MKCKLIKFSVLGQKSVVKKIFLILLIMFTLLLILVFVTYYWIESSTENYVYSEISSIPHNKVGLLLGTSKYLESGNFNIYFRNRILATANLFQSKKVDYIVISGDNSKKNYNEPLDMKNELLSYGIPDSIIFLDYAGFRTYDSVIRLCKIFGQNKFTIISQEFQNKRAIFIAKHYDLQAIAFNAQDVSFYVGLKTQIRERFARIKLFLDLIFDPDPKFLGDPIYIK